MPEEFVKNFYYDYYDSDIRNYYKTISYDHKLSEKKLY